MYEFDSDLTNLTYKTESMNLTFKTDQCNFWITNDAHIALLVFFFILCLEAMEKMTLEPQTNNSLFFTFLYLIRPFLHSPLGAGARGQRTPLSPLQPTGSVML